MVCQAIIKRWKRPCRLGKNHGNAPFRCRRSPAVVNPLGARFRSGPWIPYHDHNIKQIDIKDLSRQALGDWLADRGERPFRTQQILQWLYSRQTDRFEAMTNLGKPLRAELDAAFVNPRLTVEHEATSQDGSLKLLFRLADGQHIETVLIPEKDHYTLCISSQVGCAQGCRFCMTAKGGFVRNLSAGEIISQVRDVQQRVAGQEGMPLSNIVFMGMGEPLANYTNVVQALDIITDGDFGLKFSTRRVTVSTAGRVPRMADLGRDTRVNLAVSLTPPMTPCAAG